MRRRHAFAIRSSSCAPRAIQSGASPPAPAEVRLGAPAGVDVPDTSRGASVTLDDLGREAERLWQELPRGSVVWLSGDLGTGKTTFVRAVTRAAGAQPARSPTYALVHEYASPEGPVFHADCYRLRHVEEALDLDFPDLTRRGRLVLIEWPERAGVHAPAPDAHIGLAHGDDPLARVFRRFA